MPTSFYSLPPEIRYQIFNTIWRFSPVPSFDCVTGLVRIIPHGHSSADQPYWPGFEQPPGQLLGLPQWLLASKTFWDEGVDCLRRYPTELHLHENSDDSVRAPNSSSELWYQLATRLNVFVPLEETWFLPSQINNRNISVKHAQNLASLASLLTSKGRTKHLTITLRDDCILFDDTFQCMIETGIIMPRPIYLSELHVITAVVPQLRTFEIIFAEEFEAGNDDPAYAVMRQKFFDSLRSNIETLGFFDTRDMSLEMKKVDLDSRDVSRRKMTHTNWCFIFKRK
ncbi:uncharacterized protein EKO05_0007986 [Ascochyta rabiei]|uniref:Uncharacterized protein n=1 Tax=Didymella rabiei TaxID=5454 RepID=A0A163B8E7_DIDRA|nr:uncharacterized protein EKO05_0007986 [Ascochyta rabiei]KZM21624.1 hypothetical protein ST47_g7264 [Ascochyta rabiei]UPX17645.1 hypothetical protein EKO05_0007986 [Ascochyta rabiei]